MEVVEEPVILPSSIENEHVTISDESVVVSNDASHEVLHSNGVAENTTTGDLTLAVVTEATQLDQMSVVNVVETQNSSGNVNKCCEPAVVDPVDSSTSEMVIESSSDIAGSNVGLETENSDLTCTITTEVSEMFVGNTESVEMQKDNSEKCMEKVVIDPGNEVTFQTEVLVERSENETNEVDPNIINNDELDASKNILNALRQNIELGDVLESDVADNMENNNGAVKQEVLNKEELLDILEGNDIEETDQDYMKSKKVDPSNLKAVEAQLALQQLTRLKRSKKKYKSTERFSKTKKGEKKISINNSSEAENISKKDKHTEDVLVGETKILSEENKGKKDKKTPGTSSKVLDPLHTERQNKKDKRGLDISDESIATELRNKKDKKNMELEGIETTLTESKIKRSRKTMESSTKLTNDISVDAKNKTDSLNKSQEELESSISNDTLDMNTEQSNRLKDNIVNVLVKDWDDDEPLKDEQADKLLGDSASSVITSEQIKSQVIVDHEHVDGSSLDSSTSLTSEGQPTINKSIDESQPQRRQRVIKKKVIFDPDNPDTFTKGKVSIKNKETLVSSERELTKKNKTDFQQIPKAKSPTGKLQWKKPPPKANKQNKRLTEVDKLLMDEGAVNMIYQLTPEAPKGKKNMRTKAEFIKKIQSSTPDGKEMKFRERKIKTEETEAKKIYGGKQRGSLSSSVKSMSICEDFDAQNPDDSIIYRRHSSSSYSSTCMSPLRVNDPDSGAVNSAARLSRQASDSQNLTNLDDESIDQITDVFMSDINIPSPNEVINKSDCLSIKQKLNSKLSHVLNKRKRESPKTDKPAKQKRMSSKHDDSKELTEKTEGPQELSKLKSVKVTFDRRLAEIYVMKMRDGDFYSIETLHELELALRYVNTRKDINVTLLMSECGSLCSCLDISPLLDVNTENRTNNAFNFAETIRSLLCSVEQHTKVLCTGAWQSCSGVALALVAMSDVAVASERASFAIADDDPAPPMPGTAALTAHHRPLPRALVDNLIVLRRQLSAHEALQGGLVSRVLWPDRFVEQLQALANDIAEQPTQGLLLKKQLLSLNKSEETFQSCLEAERDLLAEYWTTEEGQELLRGVLV